MATFSPIASSGGRAAVSDREFLEDSSSSGLSRGTISKLPRWGDDMREEEWTEEGMKIFMQEQFERKKQLTLTAMNKAFVKSINAYSLVLVLLATVTYAGFLQPPGSFDNDGFLRTDSNASLTWFVYFNSLSFYFSMADLLLCLSGNFAPLADLHAESFLKHPKSEERTSIPADSVSLEQAITHRLAHFVAYTLTKAATINLLFVISLTCCVAAFAAAGVAVTSGRGQNQVPIIVTSVVGCFTYLCFMLWLLRDSVKFFWRAGFSLGAVATSLADTLAQNAGHLETQLQFCGGSGPGPVEADQPMLAPVLDSTKTFVRRVGQRGRTPRSSAEV